MSLPAPNLDDRRFQDLVDDAKRFVQQRCPSWTDHNVSDPGVTLIESFAWMTDMLLYRLNRVPDRLYVRFLELIGVTLFPPTAARADVTFRLAAQQPATVAVARGTVVSTARSLAVESVAFSTAEDLAIVNARVTFVGSIVQGGELRDHTPGMGIGAVFSPFSDTPQPDDALYLGLDQAAPSNTLLLRVGAEVGGHGIDPQNPPWVWEAWNGDRWEVCELERDTTGGLNIAGEVELHLPRTHVPTVVGGHGAPWVRCRVVDLEGVRAYRSSPRLTSVTGGIIGGTVEAVHGEEVVGEIVGSSEGVPGQVFDVERAPLVLSADPVVVEVRSQDVRSTDGTSAGTFDDGALWEEWTQVPNFAESSAGDRHFTLDPTSGEVRFGPAVRMADGTVRQHGAVPPKAATIRVRRYRTGGGAGGNVAARTLTVLRSSIPYVATVTNRRGASGGVDPESVADARNRGPIVLRTRNRAVTREDYEVLAREAAPDIARVHCVLVEDGPDAGALRVLIVPSAPQLDGRVRLDHLIPGEDTGRRIRDHLDARRVIGTRVTVEPPSYLGVTVVARLRARETADTDRLTDDALTALHRFLNPLSGGPLGEGWPFGRAVGLGDVYSVLQRVRGLDAVEEVALFTANPVTGARREAPGGRIELPPTSLVLSYEHQVRVER